ncbi:MAG: hypothetical protein COB07_08875 [Sulfurovum sp.]|nr:MAG: hypothetical protein COB07_08875 [Sulfurovum sp.]
MNQIQEKTVIQQNKNEGEKIQSEKLKAEKLQRKKDDSNVAQTNLKINRWYHPKSEPKSLYIANITVNNKNKTYRIVEIENTYLKPNIL